MNFEFKCPSTMHRVIFNNREKYNAAYWYCRLYLPLYEYRIGYYEISFVDRDTATYINLTFA